MRSALLAWARAAAFAAERRVSTLTDSRHGQALLGQHGLMTETGDVTITLTSDEALVLFELLHRWEDADKVSAPQHQGEQVVLWNLSALLERELAEPFGAEYGRLVAAAMDRLGATE